MMAITIKRGTGISINNHEEIFQIGRDWLVFDFATQSGHWFSGKRDAMRFLKFMKTTTNKEE